MQYRVLCLRWSEVIVKFVFCAGSVLFLGVVGNVSALLLLLLLIAVEALHGTHIKVGTISGSY